jgi:hypothetical protein
MLGDLALAASHRPPPFSARGSKGNGAEHIVAS